MALPEWADPAKRDAALSRIAVRLAEPDVLTRRELAVVFLISHGVSNHESSRILHVSQETIRQRAKAARAKLQAETTAHAVATALRLGLIS